MIPPVIVYHYIVQDKEFKRYPEIHNRLSDLGFTNELVRIGWGRKDIDGENICVLDNICLAEFKYNWRNFQVIEYVASQSANHPWLEGKSNFFKNPNV